MARDKRTVGERAALTLAALAYPPGQQQQQQQQLLYASPTATSATLLSRSNTSSALTLEVAFAFTPPTATDASLVVDPGAACPIAIPHDDPNNGWGASSCVGVRVRSGVATFPPPPTYTPQIPGGFIGAGGDLPGSGPMTVAAAQAACTANPACVGFTFGGDSPTPPGPVNIYLKSKYSFTRAPHWQTYNSSRPAVGMWYDVPPGNLTVSPDGRSLLVSVTLPSLGETVDAIQLGYAPWPLMGVTSSGGLPVHPFLLPVAQQQGQQGQGQPQVPGTSAAPAQRRRRLQAPPWSTLTPLQWTPLPLGVVQPRGWLAAQLAAQVSGISGYLHKFYPPVAHSPWIVNCSAVVGGCSDTNEGEDFAYWFNAAVPMAVLSGGGGGSGGDGGRLWGDVAGYVDHILGTADPATGWLGPPAGDTDGNAHWARWPVLAGLLAWREATGDGRILPALHAYMREAYRRLTQGAPLGGDWAGSRWQDFAWVIQALLDADPEDGAGQRQGLTDLLWVVYGQQTVSWEDWYTPSFFPTGDTGWNYSSHGVNAAQGLKSGAVIYRMTQGSPQAAASSTARLALLDEFHGTPVGTFFADETLSDSMPSHGTELCAVVESIFSLNAMHEALGDAAYADRAERIAYNALPGTWTSDMLSHQYLQQANAVNALHQEEHVWLADGPDATTYGLAPNYPCCTANGPQGWPRFIPRMLHLSPDGGVAVSLLGPFAANLTLPGGSGSSNNNITLAITVDTEYPFGDTVVITVENHGPTTSPPIPLWVRIPGWATGATMAINGAQGAATPPTPVPNGTMAPFSIPPPPPPPVSP